MVVQRTADPTPWIGDLAASAHWMDKYTDTAGMLDLSTDPRMDGVRERLGEFAQAESVEVFLYATAEGVSASSADGG
jgi:hypothetical protein